MSESLNKPSPDKRDLALSPDVVERLGERRYALLKLWIRDVNGAFDAALAQHIRDESIVLDAGCSRGDPDLPAIRRARYTVGCDADMAGLRANTIARHRVFTPLESLPFRSGSFDLIVCKFVLEHVTEPVRVIREFFRVLRPGGVIAVLTPNRWSLFALVSRAVPHRLKQRIKKHLFGGHPEDTFETRYRANTPRRLRSMMTAASFTEERFEMLAGMWAFFIFNSALAKAVRTIERLQARTPGLRMFSTHMLGIWRKPLGAPAP